MLSRAREKGLDGEALTRLGEEHDLPEFVAAGRFLEQYLTNLDHQGLDRLLRPDPPRHDRGRGAPRRAAGAVRARLRRRVPGHRPRPGGAAARRSPATGATWWRWATRTSRSTRSAVPRCAASWSSRPSSRAPTARPADVVALRTTRRFGSRLLLASQRVAGRLALPGTIDPAAREAFHRAAGRRPGRTATGWVVVRTFDTERAEAEHLADLLRRAHLEDGIPWHEMAVLVRSGRVSIPPLRRALGAAGVPVEVASDEVPLVRDPAVLPLLDAVRAVLELDNDDPDDPRLRRPDPGRGAADRPARRARRRRRPPARAARCAPARRSAAHGRGPLAAALARAGPPRGRRARRSLDGLDRRPEVDAGPRRRATCWPHARDQLGRRRARPRRCCGGCGPATTGRERLRRGGRARAAAAARRAHRDLDAICALFDAAARAEEQRDHSASASSSATLVAQQIPADTLAERGVRGAAVRLLTAHRAKGLEWRLVVVAHVQQDGWPDLRRRADAAAAPTGSAATAARAAGHRARAAARGAAAVLRRLHPRPRAARGHRGRVARGRRRAAVAVPRRARGDGRGGRRAARPGRCRWPAWSASCGAPSPTPTTTEPLREAAAAPAGPARRRDRRRAAAGAAGRPGDLVGHPRGHAARSSRCATPTSRCRSRRALLEASSVCPTQWFLPARGGRRRRAHQSANFGQMVHALAERVAHGELEPVPTRRGADGPRRGGLGPAASSARRGPRPASASGSAPRSRGSSRWHHANRAHRGRHRAAVRRRSSSCPTASGCGSAATPTGSSSTPTAAVVVVDLKTGKYQADRHRVVQRHVQLGALPVAVDHGAADELLPEGGRRAVRRRRAGAARAAAATGPTPRCSARTSSPTTDRSATALRGQLGRAAGYLRAETFPAVAGQHCRDCDFVPLCPVKGAGSVMSR